MTIVAAVQFNETPLATLALVSSIDESPTQTAAIHASVRCSVSQLSQAPTGFASFAGQTKKAACFHMPLHSVLIWLKPYRSQLMP